jgi:hypothetical protein
MEASLGMELLTEAGIVHDPAWSQVERALRELDGEDRTEVVLSRGGDRNYISVGGGASGRYFVFIYTEDERNLVLGNGGTEETRTRLKCSGQTVSLAGWKVTPLEAATTAARRFFLNEEQDPKLDWRET